MQYVLQHEIEKKKRPRPGTSFLNEKSKYQNQATTTALIAEGVPSCPVTLLTAITFTNTFL
jgi:hypothetical protein